MVRIYSENGREIARTGRKVITQSYIKSSKLELLLEEYAEVPAGEYTAEVVWYTWAGMSGGTKSHHRAWTVVVE